MDQLEGGKMGRGWIKWVIQGEEWVWEVKCRKDDRERIGVVTITIFRY